MSRRAASSHDAPAARPLPPARRLVLLGASNLARCLGVVVATARHLFGSPLEFQAALGHGRSYGISSRILWRELPGILPCGLWPAFNELPPAPTAALLTDIGNDILYDVRVEQIVQWVDECLARLADAGAEIVVTGLPVDNLHVLSRRRFLFFRSLFVPQCRLSLETVRGRALELNEALIETAQRRGAQLVALPSRWYGLDPIHIRPAAALEAWHTILSPLARKENLQPAARPVRDQHWRLRMLRPQQRRMWGREQYTRQPAGQLADGTTLALY